MIQSNVRTKVGRRCVNTPARGRPLLGGIDVADATCAVQGCGRAGKIIRGWCTAHYQRWQKHGDPRGGGAQRERHVGCLVAGCDGRHEGLGYCRIHYRRVRKYGTPDLPQREPVVCSVAECADAAHARHLCGKHHARWRKHGDPLEDGSRPLAERLRSRLIPGGPDGTCLEWTGATHRGYGQIGVGGKALYAHRVAWMLEHGDIPDGMHACHHCDNPPCCNVEHLFLGDDAANVADMIAKGRAHWQVAPSSRPSGGDAA